ncbi:hypothetical protein E8E13_009864 [Curvularia kusanoi]|uniref:Uncharacterized protein n=1 Tax=Curvularia kusanoi TaxID=90978 RepID=A0A9P4W9R8_CURKU|nr:hypothetical protein E8E13_009864 [Curvularia kusanoi]
MTMWWNCDAIFCGFWNNESNSFLYRGTLTLPTQWGLILVGFFTLFLKISSGYFWSSIKFGLHQANASGKPQNDLHHQVQLVLRNAESESSVISQIAKVLWVHRADKAKAFGKSVGLIAFAGLYALGFALMSGLSSRLIAAPDSSVLNVSKNCGWFQEPSFGNSSSIGGGIFDSANAISVMARNVVRRSASYSRSCYGHFGDKATSCETFVRQTLPYTLSKNLPCPFSEGACNGSTMSLDTGYLRSDTHLGINTRPHNALFIRKALTCVPIAGEKYTDGWRQMSPTAATAQGLPLTALQKGYSFGQTKGSFGSVNSFNYTITLDDVHWKFGKQPYGLKWNNAILDLPPIPAWFSFTPIPDLQSPAADMMMIGLTNRNDFASAVNDPWFAAENCSIVPDALVASTCRAENPISFLSCQEQYQFCRPDPKSPSSKTPNPDSCTALTGLFRLYPDIFLAKGSYWNGTMLDNLNPAQSALYKLLGKILSSSQLHFQLGYVGLENLIAQDSAWDGGFGFSLSASLPPDQWETEVINWMNVSLSNTQRGAITFSRPSDFDIGLGSGTSLRYMEAPTEPALRSLCDQVKVRSTTHTSFSVAAMGIIIALGLLCIVADFFVVRSLTAAVQRRMKRGLHGRREWASGSAFQLQRMAAEGRGVRPWSGVEEDVPKLEDPGRLFDLTEGELSVVTKSGSDSDQSKSGVQHRALNKQPTHQEEEV